MTQIFESEEGQEDQDCKPDQRSDKLQLLWNKTKAKVAHGLNIMFFKIIFKNPKGCDVLQGLLLFIIQFFDHFT